MKDLIDRQAAIDAIDSVLVEDESCKVWFKLAVKNLPPTQPERKRGKWEITNLGAVGVFDSCSECKRVVKHKAPFYNYCPNCGADMREDNNETD